MQTVISALSSAKFYRLPPDEENPVNYTNFHNYKTWKPSAEQIQQILICISCLPSSLLRNSSLWPDGRETKVTKKNLKLVTVTGKMSISPRNSNLEPRFSKYSGIEVRILRLEDRVSRIKNEVLERSKNFMRKSVNSLNNPSSLFLCRKYSFKSLSTLILRPF